MLNWSVWSHLAESVRHGIGRWSLMYGWVPASVQLMAGVLLVSAIVGRSRRWWLRWAPAAAILGVAAAVAAHWYVGSAGLAGDPPPPALWIWIGLGGLAAGVVGAGWVGARWRRRCVSVLAVPVCLLSAALALNAWVGYFPTVHSAWRELTAGPLPHQTDRATVTAMQLSGVIPAQGVVVPVTIGAEASKFKHRSELVYLPPAWFATKPPPRLPAVMMIGGEFNTPTDWVRAGDAAITADDFADRHGGSAPVLVFVDSGGAFNIDTECVNGPRGNAAAHLTRDVVPFMIGNFGVSGDRAQWGVAGFSAGGTCAIDLAVMHPDMFSAFVDIAGDLTPNSGTREQTIDRLFGGNGAAWAAFDPATAMTRHGPYTGVSGLFPTVAGQDAAANSLCALGMTHGIACTILPLPGKHDWPFAGRAFAAALPWLAAQLSTPGAARVQLPPPTAVPSAAMGSSTATRAASH